MSTPPRPVRALNLRRCAFYRRAPMAILTRLKSSERPLFVESR